MILVVPAFSTLFCCFFEFSYLVQRNATHLLALQSTSIAMEPTHSLESPESSLTVELSWGTTKLRWWCRLKPSQCKIQIAWSFLHQNELIGSLGCLRWRDKVDVFFEQIVGTNEIDDFHIFPYISIYRVFILGWTKKSHENPYLQWKPNRTKMEVMNNHSTTLLLSGGGSTWKMFIRIMQEKHVVWWPFAQQWCF